MASPKPPVPFQNQCSILHDNVLYVYQPNAFQTLQLAQNASWTQTTNGVSVTGGKCVKGGTDGDSNDISLYIVGGSTNSSTTGYTGLQRYNLATKLWTTITPTVQVSNNRQNHGATYLNASSAILIYGGTQDGSNTASTETFIMLMYPPYRVQAYSSIAPAVKNPYVLPYANDLGMMVGGAPGSSKAYIFHPNPGWYDSGVTIPAQLPDSTVGAANLQILDDSTKILQVYDFSQSPNTLNRYVMQNADGSTASFGETIGGAKRRRITQSTYPAYNASDAPTTTRSGASLATDGNEISAIVGGDANSTVALFSPSQNSWIDDAQVFGKQQQPLTSSISSSISSSTSTSTSTPTIAPTNTAAASPSATPSSSGQSNALAILGGVLGGICGLIAILIILLLWLRNRKRRNQTSEQKQQITEAKHGQGGGSYGGTGPLSQAGQPMGRSPVPSSHVSERDSTAMFGAAVHDEKDVEAGPAIGGSKLNPNHHANNSGIGSMFSKNKAPLQISKPMLPDLGEYQERPSIDLRPAAEQGAPALPPVALVTDYSTNKEQRKTDEGWAKYFQEDDKKEKTKSVASSNTNRQTYHSDISDTKPPSRPTTSKGGGGGFWPGAGVSTTRSTKLPTRDSEGNVLTQATVNSASPALSSQHGNTPQNIAKPFALAEASRAKFSSADSISTDHSSEDEDEYEDMAVRDSMGGAHDSWTPFGMTSRSQRPLSNPFPPPTGLSENTTNTSLSGGSSIPAFPMPSSALRKETRLSQRMSANIGAPPAELPNPHLATGHFASTLTPQIRIEHARKSSNAMFGSAQDYFGPTASSASSNAPNVVQPSQRKIPDNTDMSWINLGTPARLSDHLSSAEESTESLPLKSKNPYAPRLSNNPFDGPQPAYARNIPIAVTTPSGMGHAILPQPGEQRDVHESTEDPQAAAAAQ